VPSPKSLVNTTRGCTSIGIGVVGFRHEIARLAVAQAIAGRRSQAIHGLVLAALRELPAQQRVVLVLRYWAGLSEQEIATQLGCSPGTVKSRASRAIATLRSRSGPLADALTLTETG